MKTYIEISRPSTEKIFTSQVLNLVLFIQTVWSKKSLSSKKNALAFALLFFVCIALYFGCTLFSIIIIALFLIFLGMVINEMIQYIRFIREL